MPTPRVTRADLALADMQEHLGWLRDHRAPEGTPAWSIDLAREIGVMDAMTRLEMRGARIRTPAPC